ncbi:MAG TPA: glycoside hydrolase family 13 protein [Prolixibacteraceae bacterium]|mgnify:CR=1 FL=1|nr:glycoside hydrolase family 13 protein [Prolixibacteraceae bacterium]
MMKKIIGIIAFVLISSTLLFAKVNRIDPPMWWTGFNETTLQLMVYGDDISLLTPEINYQGVKLHAVTRAQSPNYLFIDLHIDERAKPGTFTIQFKQGKKTVSEYAYQLLERSPNSAQRKGFDNSDVMYLLFPDRFANGDTSNDSFEEMPDKINREHQYGRRGGDISGIVQKLDYLKDLGITAIWTTPLLEDNQPEGSYHHYATTDFYRVDPRFGTNEEYKAMVDKCHSEGIKVVMDMIPNHCGSAHPWMQDLPFDDWINGGTTYTQTNYRIPVTNDPYVSSYDSTLNFSGWFVSEMPDLNQNNPYMLKYLKQFAIWWVEYAGLDGIRVDTYPYNDPVKAAEWTKAVMNEFPHLNMVGECWQHSAAEVAYWQGGTLNHDGYDSGLPSVMDFVMHDAVSVAFNENEQGWDRGVGQLWHTLTADYLYADPYNLVVFAENHDTQRFSTVVGNDVKKYKLGMTFLLTTRGIPQLYYGSEILMGGDKGVGDGDIRREMPGGWPDHDRSVFTEQGRTSTENDVYNYLKKLINWRNQNPVIHNGSLLHFIPENNVYTYFRINEEKTVMVIINNNPEEQTIDPVKFNQGIGHHSGGIDVISNAKVAFTQPFKVEGKTAMVLELE